MEYVYKIFAFVAGLGAFLIGVNLLSENIRKLANDKIRLLFGKTSKSKVVSCGIGALVTAAVQSSSLITVMVVGFVNSGMMSLYQATAIIMGANIGTTVTAQIAALEAFSFSKIAMALAGIGVFTTLFAKKETTKSIGNVLSGLGLIFLGLETMVSSMAFISQSDKVKDVLAAIKNPFLLFAVGALLTAVIQNSAAMATILISMVTAGVTVGAGGNSVLFVILGTNVGTCVTALISSIGTNANAKRASLIHMMFNVFGSLLFFIILLIWKDFTAGFWSKLFTAPATQIAMFHTLFNVICTIIFLPLTKFFVAISEKLIKSDKEVKRETYLDQRFIDAPAIAISAAYKEVGVMIDISVAALENALTGFNEKTEKYTESVNSDSDEITAISEKITEYLIKVSAGTTNVSEESKINALYSNLSDVCRISELAKNITKYTAHAVNDGLSFSDKVKQEIGVMFGELKSIAELSKQMLLSGNAETLKKVEETEDGIDKLRTKLIKEHIERLNNGECKPDSSSVFINLVSNLERAGDHYDYVAHSVKA
ncbi:MAG TPA: Na/Pi cotransporter family protein [Clostridiales bacterium]|nr:Na/Pi cotransporter family protein [Clostridiales bacterium]